MSNLNEQINALKEQGSLLLQSNRLAEAKALFTQICDMHADDADAWYVLSGINGRLGNIDEAGNCCRRVIALRPEHGEAHVNLGNVLFYQKKTDEAISHYQTALRINPNNAGALCSLGNVLSAQGRHDEAAAQYQAAIRLNPNIVEAYYNLGNALSAQQKYDEAVASYRQAIRRHPNYAAAYNNLGNALKAQGAIEQAVENYRHAIKLKPDFATACNNLAILLIGQGRLEEADALAQRVLQVNPDSVEAHFNLGNIRMEQDNIEDAIVHFQRVIQLNPNYAEARNNLGMAFKRQGRLEEAKTAIEHALKLKPAFAEAICNLGYIRYSQGQIIPAIEQFRQAILLKPDYADAYVHLGNALIEQGDVIQAAECYQQAISLQPKSATAYTNLAAVFKTQGKLEAAEKMAKEALNLQPDFVHAYNILDDVYFLQGKVKASIAMSQKALQLDRDNAIAHSNLLMGMHYDSEYSAEQLFAATQTWSARYNSQEYSIPPPVNLPDPRRRLRIGYVSADFRIHPVGFFIEQVLKHHDKNQFEIICYSNFARDDELTARLRRHAKYWRDILYQTDETLAQEIRRDGIDILVDLSGHTSGNRLSTFARKPAPIQATWMGYFDTTGLSNMDYIIADRFVISPQEECHYTEQVVRLPNAYLCFSPPEYAIEPSPLPALATGRITFGCFNNTAKLTEEVIACWSRLLHALPDARLYLKYKPFGDAEVQQRYQSLFANRGIKTERIKFSGASPRKELLAAYNEVDISLDPFPVNGGVTTLEALWMGVPVVNLRGERFVSRIGETFLTNIGLGEYVADTEDAYVATAVALATDIPRLARMRGQLRSQLLNSPLCDGLGFTRDLETAFRAMWESWCRTRVQP